MRTSTCAQDYSPRSSASVWLGQAPRAAFPSISIDICIEGSLALDSQARARARVESHKLALHEVESKRTAAQAQLKTTQAELTTALRQLAANKEGAKRIQLDARGASEAKDKLRRLEVVARKQMAREAELKATVRRLRDDAARAERATKHNSGSIN